MFDKKIEYYKNTLNRATTAYEILLKKELDFYEKIDPLFAELIVIVQDLVFYSSLKNEQSSDNTIDYKKLLLRYIELIPIMKNEVLTHQVYIPINIFNCVTNIVESMQSDMIYWKSVADVLFKLTNEVNDLEQSNKISDKTLKLIAECEMLIKNRLIELSKSN